LSVLETSSPPQLFDAHGKKIFKILKETSLMDLEERTLKVEACMDRPDSMQTVGSFSFMGGVGKKLVTNKTWI
jgi:hypothetical protein